MPGKGGRQATADEDQLSKAWTIARLRGYPHWPAQPPGRARVARERASGPSEGSQRSKTASSPRLNFL
eukprot:3314418-Pyramimonas_sp.AAC.1